MMLERFYEEKGLSKSTKKHYNASVSLYEKICGKSLDDLLEEADFEERQRLPWKERKLKSYLVEFRNYLYANKSEGTVNTYLGDIKGIYRHFELELHKLPSFNSKQINHTYIKRYEDIPNKQEIIDAYYEANNVVKNIILFASSSGISKVDILNLKVIDFIIACKEYFQIIDKEFPKTDSLLDLLYALKKEEYVIPFFEGNRQKTGTRYTTFCSPESFEHILQYLIGRDAKIRKAYEDADKNENLAERLYEEDKLFDISYSNLTATLRRINYKLGLGKVGYATKFRCHQLRAYQASTLLNVQSDDKFTESEIDALQGRRADKTHRAYLIESKTKLYKKYVACVDELMLFKSIHTIDNQAYEQLKTENNLYKKEIIKNESKLEEQQKTIEQIIANQRELEALLGL